MPEASAGPTRPWRNSGRASGQSTETDLRLLGAGNPGHRGNPTPATGLSLYGRPAARRARALTAPAATGLPPRTPVLVTATARRSPAHRAAFDSAAPT